MPFEAAYSVDAAVLAAKAGLAKKGCLIGYVYLLQSESAPRHRHIGETFDLKLSHFRIRARQ
jgi:hypothetical protein